MDPATELADGCRSLLSWLRLYVMHDNVGTPLSHEDGMGSAHSIAGAGDQGYFACKGRHARGSLLLDEQGVGRAASQRYGLTNVELRQMALRRELDEATRAGDRGDVVADSSSRIDHVLYATGNVGPALRLRRGAFLLDCEGLWSNAGHE
jgi:hypothetical protein